MKFQVTIDRDEDGVWIVQCPSIPGCVSQGATKKEALEKKYKSEAEEAAKKFQAALTKVPPNAGKDLAAPMLKFGLAAAEVGKALGLEAK